MFAKIIIIIIRQAIADRCSELTLTATHLSLVSSYNGLILLRSSFSSPKLLHMLCSSLCVDHKEVDCFDNILKSSLEKIVNVFLIDNHWVQASLPVRDGGLAFIRLLRMHFPLWLPQWAPGSSRTTDTLKSRPPLTLLSTGCSNRFLLMTSHSHKHLQPIDRLPVRPCQ